MEIPPFRNVPTKTATFEIHFALTARPIYGGAQKVAHIESSTRIATPISFAINSRPVQL